MLPTITLAVTPTAVRDLCIPLGAFSNVVVAHDAPRLPGATGSIPKKCRTTPVLLGRRSRAAITGPGFVREFACEPHMLLPILADKPLLVELWHHDKYASDVLLGVASLDLAEVLSAQPSVDGAGITKLGQEQTIPFAAPPDGVGAKAIAPHVALLDLTLRIEIAPPPPPKPAPPPKEEEEEEEEGVGVGGRKRGGGLSGSSSGGSVSMLPSGGGGAAARRALESSGSSSMARSRKLAIEAAAKAELAKKEEALLRLLEREWKVHESKRANEARSQARAIAAATKELKHKLLQLLQQEEMMASQAEQLALQKTMVEQQLEVERATIMVEAEEMRTDAGAEAEGARRQLMAVQQTNAELKQAADAMRDRQAHAELEASVWRNAHSAVSARALSLESEKGQLAAALEAEKARAASLLESQKKAQRKRQAEAAEAERRAATTADVAASLPVRLAEIKRETEAAFGRADHLSMATTAQMVDKHEGDLLPLVEVAAVDRRLREHANELQQEARELDECRQLLATRAQVRRDYPTSKSATSSTGARSVGGRSGRSGRSAYSSDEETAAAYFGGVGLGGYSASRGSMSSAPAATSRSYRLRSLASRS